MLTKLKEMKFKNKFIFYCKMNTLEQANMRIIAHEEPLKIYLQFILQLKNQT